MVTTNKKYNFSKFINFLRTIDGDLDDASIETIIDSIYDETCDRESDNGADEIEPFMEYEDFSEFITNLMKNTKTKNTIIKMVDNEENDDLTDIFFTIKKSTYVMTISKYIYAEMIENWLYTH